jgi:hypothetical protein
MPFPSLPVLQWLVCTRFRTECSSSRAATRRICVHLCILHSIVFNLSNLHIPVNLPTTTSTPHHGASSSPTHGIYSKRQPSESASLLAALKSVCLQAHTPVLVCSKGAHACVTTNAAIMSTGSYNRIGVLQRRTCMRHNKRGIFFGP